MKGRKVPLGARPRSGTVDGDVDAGSAGGTTEAAAPVARGVDEHDLAAVGGASSEPVGVAAHDDREPGGGEGLDRSDGVTVVGSKVQVGWFAVVLGDMRLARRAREEFVC